MRKVLAVIVIVTGLSYLFLNFDVLPTIGDPNAPAHHHVSDYYIDHALRDTESPNLVTAVLADYRGFDTLLETTVMFLAGMSAVLLLSYKTPLNKRKVVPNKILRGKHILGEPAYQTINKEVMVTLIEVLILIYAMYVLFHGEVSLGGGFQAGALIALAYIIDVMVAPNARMLFRFDKRNSVSIAGIGVSIYAFTGVITMLSGGVFLEYGKLPHGMLKYELHPAGILMIETGVTLCVMATIVAILNAIMERAKFDDDRD